MNIYIPFYHKVLYREKYLNTNCAEKFKVFNLFRERTGRSIPVVLIFASDLIWIHIIRYAKFGLSCRLRSVGSTKKVEQYGSYSHEIRYCQKKSKNYLFGRERARGNVPTFPIFALDLIEVVKLSHQSNY